MKLRWPGLWEMGLFAAYLTILVFLDGLVGVAVAAMAGVLWCTGARPRDLIATGVLLLGLVPVVVLLVGLPPTDVVSTKIVARQIVASHLAFAGVAYVITGVLLDVRERGRASLRPTGSGQG